MFDPRLFSPRYLRRCLAYDKHHYFLHHKLWEVSAIAYHKDGTEIAGGHIGSYPVKEEAITKIMEYLERSIRAGGHVEGSIEKGFTFDEPQFKDAEAQITLKREE